MSNKTSQLAVQRLHGTIRICSDIHLGPLIPDTCRAFYRFLEDSAAQTDHLILAGDIFDHWIGDDAVRQDASPWLREALTHLQAFAARRSLHLMTGNRDFLLGRGFADDIGAQLLPCEVLLETDFGSIGVCHGDQLCRQEKWFMRFRRISHCTPLQKLFLALPFAWRQFIGRQARAARSNHSDAHGTYDGIDPAAAETFFREHPHIRILIHGHTHYPGNFPHRVDGHLHTRLVLSDWHFDGRGAERADYIQIDPCGLQRHSWRLS